MNYVEYRKSDGFVRAVHDQRPDTVEEGFEIAEYNGLRKGIEYEYVVYIDPESTIDGEIHSYHAVRQGPPQEEVMRRIKNLENEIEKLKGNK